MKPRALCCGRGRCRPAAFGRLCVETDYSHSISADVVQPPSGGCVLKLALKVTQMGWNNQPPSGGCVLKPRANRSTARRRGQPPSGGCVLKPPTKPVPPRISPQPPSGGCVLKRRFAGAALPAPPPAAFGRLCVETVSAVYGYIKDTQPPSGGCVLKPRSASSPHSISPAAFGRLCVETPAKNCTPMLRSPAAFGRLCVETDGV